MLNSMGDVSKQSISHAFYTYAHINPTTNKIFYIGKGRKYRHLATARRNPHWQNIVNKHGFTAEILAYWRTSEETKQKIKQKLIGRIMSEESRLKMIATKLFKRGQS